MAAIVATVAWPVMLRTSMSRTSTAQTAWCSACRARLPYRAMTEGPFAGAAASGLEVRAGAE